MKAKIDRFLNESSWGGFILVCLIFVSILAFTLETEYQGNAQLKLIGRCVAGIFALEYLLRIWSSSLRPKGRVGYVFSFYGIIDLVSFLPALIFPAASGGVLVRIVRLARLAQILKIKSVRKAIHKVGVALSDAKEELLVSFAISALLIFLGAVGMYVVEGAVQPETFGSIPRALWWSMATLTTVGYGDVYPITAIGKLLASLIAMVGIAAVAMPAGILAAAFSKIPD